MKIISSLNSKTNINNLLKSSVNAIMLSLEDFSMRYPITCNISEIKDIVSNKNDKEIYININKFFVEEELEQLEDILLKLKDINIDGIYYTDLAVYQICKDINFNNILIYNPDTLLTNTLDVGFYLNEGNKRVVISKEITLEESINIIRNNSNIEMIIHGHMNMMDSKRKLLSNYMIFINKDNEVVNNYNLTIQEELRKSRMPIFEDNTGTHIFTSSLLQSFEEISILEKEGLNYAFINSIFMEDGELIDCINLYSSIINGKEYSINEYLEKYNKEYFKGFYYDKTILKKGEEL